MQKLENKVLKRFIFIYLLILVRKYHQRYILWEIESPAYVMSFKPEDWNGFFNWTHTFRKDADFWEPWGLINQISPFPRDVELLINESKNKTYLANGKKQSIAWIVSNCRSKSGREIFIKKLSSYIQVDVYGRCGQVSCSDGLTSNCWENIEKSHYFYFSGENSLCKDYVTMAFFNAMKRNIIPIVFGGGMGTNDYSFAPRHSFINAFDYNSPDELASYLLYLQDHPKEYVSYLWWKPYYNVWFGRKQKTHCEICDMLHENKVAQDYEDMYDWWVGKAKCKPKYI